MSDIILHHIKITYDESDERVRKFVKHLKFAKEELESYYENALSRKGGKINVSDKDSNEFTLICNAGHNCILCLRGMEKI